MRCPCILHTTKHTKIRFMPDLLRTFLYTRHDSGFWLIDAIMALVSSEVHCAACFSRCGTAAAENVERYRTQQAPRLQARRSADVPALHTAHWLRPRACWC